MHTFTAQSRPRSPPDSLDSTVPCPAVSSLINALFPQIPTPLLPGFLFPDSLTRISAEILSLTSADPTQEHDHSQDSDPDAAIDGATEEKVVPTPTRLRAAQPPFLACSSHALASRGLLRRRRRVS